MPAFATVGRAINTSSITRFLQVESGTKIYLTSLDEGGDFMFPSNPEEIKRSMSTNYRSYDIITLGEVKVPRGTECEKISWDGWFWGQPRKNMDYLGDWRAPKKCETILRKWYRKGERLRLMVTGTTINMDVTIAKFEPKTKGGFGDIPYSIEFIQDRELKMYTTSEMKVTTYEKKTTPRAKGKSKKKATTGTSYTIKQGDNLWAIARKAYGDGSKNIKIYEANADILDKAARKYGRKDSNKGWWIYPGVQIVIP